MPNHTMQFFYITFTSAVGKFHFFCRQFCLLPVGRLRRVPYCHSQKQPRSALFLFFFYPLSHKCGGDKSTFFVGSFAYCRWDGYAVPPTVTRKNSRALRCSYFSFIPSRTSAVGIKEKQPLFERLFLLVGAGGRTRTDTDFTPQDFESSASASFTTLSPHRRK